MSRIRKVLITGGSGRIGRHVIDKLRPTGVQIRVTDLKPCEYDDVEFVQGNITDLRDAKAATEGVDGVIHLAAIPVETGDADKIFDINVRGTFSILEACAQNHVKRFVLASSVVTYGVVDPTQPFVPHYFPIDENVPTVPDRNYGAAKVIGEDLCIAYSRRNGIDCISLRIASVMFPDSPFWKSAVADIGNPEHELVPGMPMTRFMWQYVHVNDVAQAFVLATERLQTAGLGFDAFNIGAEDVFSSVPSLELIKRYYPNVPALLRPAEFVSDEHRTLFDISKAREMLGYKPEYTWRCMS